MSGSSDVVHIQGGSDMNFTDVTKDGHQQIESSYKQATFPVRRQFPQDGSAVQLENIPCAKVVVQNLIGNDPIYVGGLGEQTPYIDKNYPGDFRGMVLNEGMAWPFQVDNANKLQVIGTPLQSFTYMAYPNINTVIKTNPASPPSPDQSPPVVTNTDPTDTDIDVPVNKIVTITMNESIRESSVIVDNISVSPAPPAGDYQVYLDPLDDEKIKIDPNGDLAEETLYTITLLQDGIRDLSDNGIASDFVFSFTTTEIDVTAPTVSSTDPVDTATGVSRDKTITITMSEAMDPLSVSNTTITMSTSPARNTFVDGSDPTKIKIDPTSDLAASEYTVTLIAGGVKDLAGNAIAAQFQFSFTTEVPAPPADTTPPTITSRNPGSGVTNVPRTTNVLVTFSEALDPLTVNTNTVELFNPSLVKISATVTLENGDTRARLKPNSNLNYSTVYTMFVRTGIKDVAGNNLVSTSTWSFTITAPLTITNRTPAPSTTDVPISTNVVVDFDEALQPATVTNNSFELFDTSTSPNTELPASINLSNGNRRVILTPTNALKYATTYQMFVRSTVKDVNGDDIGTSFISWTFTTESQDIVLVYNLTGTSGEWWRFGDTGGGSNDRWGRGLKITNTNISSLNALNRVLLKEVRVRARRIGSFSGRDDTMYVRIRSSTGSLKSNFASFSPVTNINIGSNGSEVKFINTGNTYILKDKDCILVEYDDGNDNNHFELNVTLETSGAPYSNEVFTESNGTVKNTSKDMAATMFGIRT